MKRNRAPVISGISFIIAIILAIIAESIYNSPLEYKIRTKRFNRILVEKEKITENCLINLKEILEKESDIETKTGSSLFTTIKKEGITILEYFDKKLAYWSDNSFEVPAVYNDTLFSKPFVFIHNGWFITKKVQSEHEIWIALLRVRNEYGFENKLVRNGFLPDYKMSAGTEIITGADDTPYKIYNHEGIKLFSIRFPEVRKFSLFSLIPTLFWILSLLLLIDFSLCIAGLISKKGNHLFSFIFLFSVFSLIYLLFLITGKPSIFKSIDLFSGYHFTLGNFLPSLGHLLLLSTLLFALILFFFKKLPIELPEIKSGTKRVLVTSLLLISSLIVLSGFHFILTKLIFDSNITFEPYRILELSLFTLAGYISIIILAGVTILYTVKILQAVKGNVSEKEFFLSLALSVILFLPAVVRNSGIIIMVIYYLIFVSTIHFALDKKITGFNLMLLISLFFTVYTLYFVITLSEEKSIAKKKVMAVTYSTEHDPEAEHLLINIWPAISSDSLLRSMACREFKTQDEIDSITYYLHNTYFNGYWGNYSLSVVSCSDDSPLRIASEEKMLDNCFNFFSERIEKFGHQITGTGFYFLEGQGGRSYYLGQIFYKLDNNRTRGLFIELFSEIDFFQEGYSELLLDRKYQGYSHLKYYSFAKYINGNLVLHTGDFPYDKTDEAYVDREYDYTVFNREGYQHVLYRNGNVTVLISDKEISFTDVIISFAYLFIFTLLSGSIILLFIKKPDVKKFKYFNFRQKLQISFISVLLLSFISMGIIVAIFTINQYKARHLENIKEKINSIYTEIEARLALEPELSLPGWREPLYPSLEEFLVNLSNVFNTDINLYDNNGYLIATSRPEVFYRNLTSRRLNMDAFINLETLTKSEYIQWEKIASLEYLSAYVPFYNNNGQLLAYLNLPYFRMQSVLTREISNVIVTIANFTLLIILITMAFGVIISRRLTAPLNMLSQGLASVELGKKSEHLVYNGHDEIGELVNQYNKMVDELQESAHRLADSEREYAWREMAKQVAHEIKNPLTPMKLNIQQLYKTWKDGKPGFEKQLEKFTKNQIEYIENLSTIASAFSSFAKLPSARPVDFDLVEQIKTTLELFKDTENIFFRINWPVDKQIIVHADKEHINGIFSNLIKNAIQSIPQGREGIIKISVDVKGDSAVVSVADNGIGIPDELKGKMFTLNFTTKSSGMGMGLSIVKRYVETAGGRVWFESEKDKGSVFFVELPVNFTVERIK